MGLIPRFYYTLPFFYYCKPLIKKTSYVDGIYTKSSNNYWFNNSRVGLRLLLDSMSTNKPLKVGVQAYTCHTVFQAIVRAGHSPIFLDLTDDFKLDLNHLKKNIYKIDVLIVTHTFGFPDDMDSIKKIAGEIVIIEDCAHSFLSKYKESYTGTICDAAIYSTGLAKFPAIGSGGWCTINKPGKFPLFTDKYAEISEQTQFSSFKNYLKVLIYSIMMKPPFYGLITYRLGKKLDKKLDLGNKYSFDEYKEHAWSQNILTRNFSFFDKMLAKNIENATLLSSLLKVRTSTLNQPKYNTLNYYIFPLLIDNRDELYDKLLKQNIEPGKHFHKSLIWASEFGYAKGDCSNTERIIERIITIPVHNGVNKKTITKISNIINEHKS